MAHVLWSFLASFLAASPRLTAFLLRRAQSTPYWDLEGYMERWWLIEPLEWKLPDGTMRRSSTPILSRLLPAMRFHRIHRADNDRNLHDHPWAFRSLILDGSYFEERMDLNGQVQERLRFQGDSYSMGLGEFHRITFVHGPVLTLCVLGQRQESWGFLVHGEKVHWRDYLYPQGAALV